MRSLCNEERRKKKFENLGKEFDENYDDDLFEELMSYLDEDDDL